MKTNLNLILAAIIVVGSFGAWPATAEKKNNVASALVPVSAQVLEPFKSDESITREIREKIRSTDNLADSARNVQVITRDGMVTLIGTVDKVADIDQLSQIAATVVPAENVDNEVTVATASLMSSAVVSR